MKPPIEFRPSGRTAHKSPELAITPKSGSAPVSGDASAVASRTYPLQGRGAKTVKVKSSPQPKPASPTAVRAKGRKKATKPKKAASTLPKPRKTTASVAKDIPALKQRFLAGALVDSDWDDITALLDAAEARRLKNKAKQQEWRARK